MEKDRRLHKEKFLAVRLIEYDLKGEKQVSSKKASSLKVSKILKRVNLSYLS
jgi:hypothetical protein